MRGGGLPRRGLGDSMADFFLGKKAIDRSTLDELETSLLSADVGVEATSEIIDDMQARLSRKALGSVDALQMALWKRHMPKGVIVHSDRGASIAQKNTKP